MPSEVQPFCRIARSILVRIMSKVACAGSMSAKVTMRLLRHQPRVGLEGGELGPGRPDRRRRGAAAAAAARPRAAGALRRGPVAAPFLGLLDGGLDAFHRSLLPRPAQDAGTGARAEAERLAARRRTGGRAACSRCARSSSASGITPSATTSAATIAPRFQRISAAVRM